MTWISPFRSFPEAGGVMSYGPNQLVMYRGLAVKALGLTVPPSLVLRANQVIG